MAAGDVLDEPEADQLAERLVDLGHQRAGRDRRDDLTRQPPAELLGDLVADGLGALGVVRAQVDVDEAPAEVAGDLRAEPVDLVVVAVDGDQGAAVDRGGDELACLEVARREDAGAQPGPGGRRGNGAGEVAGGGAADRGEPELLRRRQRDGDDAVLERVRGVAAVVLDPQRLHAERRARLSALTSLVMPGAEVLAGGDVGRYRQQRGVAPHRLRAGLDVGVGDGAEVVADLERAEALHARVGVTEREGGATGATDELARRAERGLARQTVAGVAGIQ